MMIEYPSIEPPSRRDAFGELRFGIELVRGASRWLRPRRVPAVTARSVILLPGFGAGERSMVALARTLRANGHRVHDWGLGRNSGEVDRLLSALRQRVGALVEEQDEPLLAVGWSLGGYLAREVAREIPERFVKVITLGSPIVGGPRYTAAAHWYRSRGFDLDEIEREVAERYRLPLTVPVVAIYSKRDGVVAWQACIDHWSPHVRHVEVGSTHLGMAFCPQVLDLVSAEAEAGSTFADQKL